MTSTNEPDDTPIFTYDEVMTYTQFPCGDEMPFMHVAEFNVNQFNSNAAAHRGSKAEFTDALHFWLWSLYYAVQPVSDDFRPYARESRCEAISESDYFAVVDGFVSMLKRPGPDFLIERGEFIRATRVLYQSFVFNVAHGGYIAEYQNHYVSFHSWVDL